MAGKEDSREEGGEEVDLRWEEGRRSRRRGGTGLERNGLPGGWREGERKEKRAGRG